jgi:hypothetical protein
VKALFVAALLVFAVAVPVAAHVPPGNDGNNCHGANQVPCRPDPQPSHGQDCQPHGNNPDGNDDHCAAPSIVASEAPSTVPSMEPSEAPSQVTEPSTGPSAAPSDELIVLPVEGSGPPNVDTGGGQPGSDVTPPPTDATSLAVTRSDNSWLVALFLVLVSAAAFVVPRRRKVRA